MPVLILSKKAENDFSKLPKTERKKIIKKLKSLEKTLGGKPLIGKLKGLWSLRAWPYRIIFELKKSQVIVHRILHRKNVYKKL